MVSKYLKQGEQGNDAIWAYVVVFLLVLLAWQGIGSIPVLFLSESSVQDWGSETVGQAEVLQSIVEHFGSEALLLAMLFSFLCGFVVLLLGVRYVHRKQLLPFLTTSARFRWRRVGWGMLIWGVFSLIQLAIFFAFAEPDTVEWSFELQPFVYLLLICLLLMPFQTSFEELLFRSYGLQGLALRCRNNWMPIVITSILFGLVHGLNPEIGEFGAAVMFPQYILMGVLLAVVTVMDEGVELAIGIHFVNNFLAAILVSYPGEVLQTNALFRLKEMEIGHGDTVIMLVMILLFVFLCKYLFNWGSFRKLIH